MIDVVQVVPFQGPGGMQQVARILDEALPSLGVTSQVRALRASQGARPTLTDGARQWRGLVQLWRRQRPRAVVAHAPVTALVSLTAAAVARVPHRVAVIHENARSLRPGPLRLLTVLARAGVVTRLVPVGPAVGASLVGLDPQVARHVTVIVNGVPAADAAPAAAGLPPLRSDAMMTVITAGRLVPGKNLELLVRAVAGSSQPVGLVVCGDGPDRARLETLSRELGVAVRFTGMLDQRSLQESYAGADLFAFSSCSEGLPLVLVEAAAAGLPVLASDIPGNRDVLGDSAVYLPVDDGAGAVRRWSEAIDRLAQDSGSRDRMRRDALERLPAFSPGRMAEGYAALFRGPARVDQGAGVRGPSPARPPWLRRR